MPTITTKKFEAILAKNDIARELRDYKQHGEVINYDFVQWCLIEIEKYLGEANQPSVTDIIECKEHRL